MRLRPRYAARSLSVVAVGLVLACGACDRQAETPAGAQGIRCVEVFYQVTVPDVPAGADRITAWAPIPPTDAHQTLDHMELEQPLPYRLEVEPAHGNRLLVVDLSEADRSDGAVGFTAVFCVTRQAYRVLGSAVSTEPLRPEQQAEYLAPDPLVPTTGQVAEEARRVAGDAEEPLRMARRVYDHLIETMEYKKVGEGWGKGDAVYACNARRGNCSDFHSLFIGEVRSLNVPARFTMGLPLPEDKTEGGIPGYHCWAEFYLPEEQVWVPVDASEAHRRPEKREAFFGGLDEHRVAFSRGRQVPLPDADAEPLNFVIYAHVEVDGKPHPGVQTSFRFADRERVRVPTVETARRPRGTPVPLANRPAGCTAKAPRR